MTSRDDPATGEVTHDVGRYRSRDGSGSNLRWAVHLGLIVTAVVSMFFEPMILAIHIVVGLVFVALVVAHLGQRRRTSLALLRGLTHLRTLHRPRGRLALADTILTVLTAAMLVSGLWDWLAGHPTKVRWHAITGVVLLGYLVVHVLNRQSRLRQSRVR